MDKFDQIDIENKNIKPHKHLSAISIKQINHILEHPTEEFEMEVDHVLNRIINVCTKKLDSSPESQKALFDETCNFLNKIFANARIKKFYNNAPNGSIKSYEKLSLGQQALHNIYGKERLLFYRDQVHGGSCHHRAIFLNSLFEKLKEKGLQVKNKIVLYSETEGHSMVVLEFQGEKYWADVFGDHDHDDIIRKVDKKDNIYDEKDLLRRKEIGCFDTHSFADHMESKPIKNIKLIFKPKLEGNCSNEIEIIINNEDIVVSVGGRSYNVFFDHGKDRKKGFGIPKKLPDSQVIDYLIQNSKGNKDHKQEISKYISMVRDKINISKVRDLF